MVIKIKKFPPITQPCEIDLSKKVTIFVGQNNSGKTYLSQLVWGLNNYAFNTAVSILQPYKFISIEKTKVEIDLSNDEILNHIAENYKNTFLQTKQIDRIFGIDNLDLNLDFSIKLNKNTIKSKKIENITRGKVNFNLHKRKNAFKLHINVTNDNKELTVENIEIINGLIENRILRAYLAENPIYMPSTRLFFPSFYKYIFSQEHSFKEQMVSNFDKINNKNKNFFISSYTKPIKHLIDKLIFELKKTNIKKNKYLETLEKLIEGSISVNIAEDIGMADISYKTAKGKELPMYLSSSMVNQLSTIYLYFKYWYQENENFLLLDEPEMNLHPSKKIKFIELLLDYASNNKLLIATHSSTMAKTIINYIHLADLKEKESKDKLSKFIEDENLDLNLDIELSSNDIAVYYFNGKTVVPYKEDNKSNIHFGTFTEIEEKQRKQFDYLMDRLEENES